MLNKAQLDALVIDGDGHDEDVIALFAHARESLTVLVEVREIAKRIDGQEGAELRDILAPAKQPEDVPAATYDKIREEVSSAPTEPTSAENELEFDDGMNEGEGQREPEAPITEDVSASAPVALSPHIYDDALMDNAALKAEVERLRGLLEGRVDVTEIHLADGSLDLLGTHPLIPAIASEMAEMLRHGPGNHVAMSARDKTGQEFSIVVQRSYGKTPAQRIAELQEQLAAAQAEVARLEADNTAIGEDQEAMSKQLAAAESRATDLAASLEAQTRKNVLLRAVIETIQADKRMSARCATTIKAAKDGGAL